MKLYRPGHLHEVQVGDDTFLIAFDSDYIRRLVPFELDDEDCDDIARDLEAHFSEFVATWAREWRIDHPRGHEGPFVGATLYRQAWVGPKEDYAMEVGEVDFDCGDALNDYALSELPPYADWFHERGWLDHGDELFFTSVSHGLVPDWDGPFELYVDEDDYETYMDDRVTREYGCSIRSEE